MKRTFFNLNQIDSQVGNIRGNIFQKGAIKKNTKFWREVGLAITKIRVQQGCFEKFRMGSQKTRGGGI